MYLYAKLRHSLKKWNQGLSRLPGAKKLAQLIDRAVERGPVWITTKQGFELLVDPRDHAIGREIVATRTWQQGEVNAIEEQLSSGMTVIDVGANVGFFTGLFAQLVGTTGRVVAIEPEPRAHAMLTESVRRNGWTQVEVLHMALGEQPGFAEISIDDSNWGNHSFAPGQVASPAATATVRMSTLAAEIAERGINTVDLMKVDVQGWEAFVYLGGGEAISKIDRHLVEFDPAALRAAGSDPSAFLETVRQMGHTYLIDQMSGKLTPVDDDMALRLPESPEGSLIDLLVTPRVAGSVS